MSAEGTFTGTVFRSGGELDNVFYVRTPGNPVKETWCLSSKNKPTDGQKVRFSVSADGKISKFEILKE